MSELETKITSSMRTRIIEKVKRVLFLNHSHHEKKRVLESKGRLNFACPYCGDSTENVRKKRGNIYWDDLYFHCYNCSHHTSLDEFLSDFENNFEGEDRISIVNYIQDNRKDFSGGEHLEFHLFEKINDLALTFDEVSIGFNIYPINESTFRAYPYLKSRLLHNQLDKFAYDPRAKKLYVFNKTPNGKIVGFQVRKLDDSAYGPKYDTWNLSRIYEKINRPLDVEPEDLDSLNKISMLFGILSVNLEQPFTIFEGPIDAMFMYNSIGLTGVKKQIIEFDQIPTARYFFDNDKEGIDRMMDKLKIGQYVFMWDKLISDYGINPRKVKDLNDLVKYEYKHRTGCLKNLDKYFTNNELDVVFL